MRALTVIPLKSGNHGPLKGSITSPGAISPPSPLQQMDWAVILSEMSPEIFLNCIPEEGCAAKLELGRDLMSSVLFTNHLRVLDTAGVDGQ